MKRGRNGDISLPLRTEENRPQTFVTDRSPLPQHFSPKMNKSDTPKKRVKGVRYPLKQVNSRSPTKLLYNNDIKSPKSNIDLFQATTDKCSGERAKESAMSIVESMTTGQFLKSMDIVMSARTGRVKMRSRYQDNIDICQFSLPENSNTIAKQLSLNDDTSFQKDTLEDFSSISEINQNPEHSVRKGRCNITRGKHVTKETIKSPKRQKLDLTLYNYESPTIGQGEKNHETPNIGSDNESTTTEPVKEFTSAKQDGKYFYHDDLDISLACNFNEAGAMTKSDNKTSSACKNYSDKQQKGLLIENTINSEISPLRNTMLDTKPSVDATIETKSQNKDVRSLARIFEQKPSIVRKRSSILGSKTSLRRKSSLCKPHYLTKYNKYMSRKGQSNLGGLIKNPGKGDISRNPEPRQVMNERRRVKALSCGAQLICKSSSAETFGDLKIHIDPGMNEIERMKDVGNRKPGNVSSRLAERLSCISENLKILDRMMQSSTARNVSVDKEGFETDTTESESRNESTTGHMQQNNPNNSSNGILDYCNMKVSDETDQKQQTLDLKVENKESRQDITAR